MNIIKYRKIYFSISAVLVALSIAALLMWGLKLGIDFTGGSLMELEFKERVLSTQEIKEKLGPLNLGEINIQPAGERGIILRLKDIDESTHQSILSLLGEVDQAKETSSYGVEEKRFESVGPVIGEELRRRALIAIGLAILMIIVYITWVFRQVSRSVPSWLYGLAAIIALVHDVSIPTGIFSVLGHFRGVEIGLLFITALLTILGFSVHDTIVVFDRIRENLRKGRGENFEDTINLSIKQTFTRSINTSLTVLLTLLAIYFFGGETIKYFTLILIFGIVFGTYSSIFVASPLLLVFEKWRRKKSR